MGDKTWVFLVVGDTSRAEVLAGLDLKMNESSRFIRAS